MLIEATEYYEWQEGFISANIQRSLDGTAVVNYAQWKSKDAFEKCSITPITNSHE
jgi:heme-degrading monooxygenase HmoA